MSLKGFMDKAYQGKARSRHLETHKGDVVFGLEDLSERLGPRPSKDQVAELVDDRILPKFLSTDPGKKYMELWGCLTSVAADRSLVPLRLPVRDFAGFQMSSGVLILETGGNGGNHLGERMDGGRIFIKGQAGSHLGQDMSGGGIVTDSCGDYAFKGMKGGWGVILGDSGSFIGLGNSGGRIAIRGSCGERAGWLMRQGSLRIKGNAGDYLGLLMSGGEIKVMGMAGARAGWRMKGGTIFTQGGYGPEAGSGAVGGEIL